MALFETKNLTFSYPLSDKTALKNVDLKVEQGEFILVMGKSGSGKSTLLRLLKKEIAPVGKIGGEININCDSIGFVGQNPETSFVCDNVRSELAFALENEKYSNDEITVRIGETASFFNLNFLLDKKIDELSGGEKASVAIASAIISDVQVLLLDEPLSQLDPKAVTTVSSMLKRINEELGVTVIVVSHSSEEFIDFCDRLVILENGEIICNDTPYNAKNNASLLPYFPICTRLFDERPLNIKSAVSLADKLKEKPLENKNENKSEVCVNLKNITFAYNKNQRDILSRLDFKAYKAQINCIIGANGSGKTTLLKILMGDLSRDDGTFKFGASLMTGYFDQVQAKLDLSKTVLDEVWSAYPFMTETKVRNALAAFLFKGEEVYRKLDVCSGGERARVALLKLMLGGYNFLLLDEPTNHLDAFSREELENTLLNYSGTMLIVSHDRYFINKLATRIVELTPNGCNNFLGNYDDYSEHRYVSEVKKEEKQKPKVNDYKLKKERQSNLRKLNTLLKRLEEEIDETENEIGKYESQLSGAEYEKLMEYTSKIDELSKKRDVLYEKWENASLELAQLEEE